MFVEPETDLELLHQFAELIGLKRAWFQDHRRLPHYDLHPNKRALAVSNGAIEVSLQDVSVVIRRWARIRNNL